MSAQYESNHRCGWVTWSAAERLTLKMDLEMFLESGEWCQVFMSSGGRRCGVVECMTTKHRPVAATFGQLVKLDLETLYGLWTAGSLGCSVRYDGLLVVMAVYVTIAAWQCIQNLIFNQWSWYRRGVAWSYFLEAWPFLLGCFGHVVICYN